MAALRHPHDVLMFIDVSTSQTLLCAMYPRVNFDLPVLMLQVTADASGITSAFIDACPVNAMRQLPPYYAAPVR